MVSLTKSNNNSNRGAMLSGSKLVLLEGSLGYDRHHVRSVAPSVVPRGNIIPAGGVRIVNSNNQTFSGSLGYDRHHVRSVNDPAPGGGGGGSIDPAPGGVRIVSNQNQTFSGLGSRRHFRKFAFDPNASINAMPRGGIDLALPGSSINPAGDGSFKSPDNFKTFETIFDNDGKPISIIDPKVQRKIEKTLLGNQWSGVFPTVLLGNEMIRKSFFKMIANNGGAMMPKRYTGGVMPRYAGQGGKPKHGVIPGYGSNGYDKVPVEWMKKVYKDTGLLGGDEADRMDGVELLGFANVIRVAVESPNPDSDLYLLGELERMVADLHGDIYGNEDLLGSDVMPELRKAISSVYVDQAGFLRGDEFEKMDDIMLGSIFSSIGKFFKGVGRGIKKIGGGIWKGVKGVGKFVGRVGKGFIKGVGNVAKGIGKVAGKVGTGLWKGIKGAGRFVGNVVKTIGKGALAAGKFALKNAGGLLKAGLSFIPGGGIAAGLLDLVLPDSSNNQEQEQQQSQEQQYAPQYNAPTMSNETGMYPPQQQYIDPTQYVDPSMYQQQVDPSMYQVAPEQVFTDPTQYQYVTPEQDQQLSDEYYEVANDPNQEEMTQGEAVELLGNFIQDVGKFLKKGVKKVGDFALNNPELLPISQRDMLFIGNKFQQGAQFKSQKNAVNSQSGLFADWQSKQLDNENNFGTGLQNIMSTYGVWIALGGAALLAILMMSKK